MAAILLGLVMAVSAQAADYQLFYVNGKAGIKNNEGQILIPATFDALGWTDGSFSLINQVTGYRSSGKWGLISLQKELITKAIYETLTSSGGDRIVASKLINPFTTKYGCLDLTGKVTVPFNYDGISILGLRAIVFVKNGSTYQYGLIDLNDKGILPLRYRDIRTIGTLRLAVQNFEQKTALFSDEGAQLTDFTIDSISAFYKGKAIVYQGFQQGLINREGTFDAELSEQQIRIDPSGQAYAKPYDQWSLLTIDHQTVHSIRSTDLRYEGSNYHIQVLNKHGLVAKDLRQVLPVVYDYLGAFENGMAVSSRNKKFGLINRVGKEVVPFQFDTLVYQRNFLRAGTKQNGRMVWSLYDTFGVCKTSRMYDRMDAYTGKFFPVSSYGYEGGVDRYGKEILHCVYDSVLQSTSDWVVVSFKGQYGILDYDERWKVLPQKNRLRLIDNERYIEHRDSLEFVNSFSGEVIFFSSHPLRVKENYLEEVRPDGSTRSISLQGLEMTPVAVYKPIVPTEKIFDESEGYRGILRDGKYGFVDQRNRLRIANRYEGIGRFKEGLAAVRIMGRWGFVNSSDKVVINPAYEAVEEFHQGTSIVRRNGKTGLINSRGEQLLECRYDSIYREKDRLILLQQGRKGLSATDGLVLIEPRFTELQLLPNKRVLVEIDSKWGLLTEDGLSIIPPIYEQLSFLPEENLLLAQRAFHWSALSAKSR